VVRRLFLLATLLACGCPAAHSGAPSRACTERADCFAGEVCDTMAQRCVAVPPDMTVPIDLASDLASEDAQ
jgi:hypothetical protein